MTASSLPARMRRLEDGVYVSGQLSFDDVDAAAAAGLTVLVCHRPDHEDPEQPPAASLRQSAERHGLTFVHLPISGLPDAATVKLTAEALGSAKGGVLMFCRSGMRSAAAWAMARRQDGAEPDMLRAAAASAGHDLGRVPL